MAHRHSHYWLWFLLFGVIPLLQALTNGGLGANAASYETYWLVGAGLLGIIVGLNGVNGGKLAQPYDVIIGIIFTIAGLVGILADFKVGLGGIDTFISHNVGLSMGGLYPLVHTFLGFKSLHHGIRPEKS